MEKKKIAWMLPVLVSGILLLGACQPQQTKTIAISGTGEVVLVPDMAYINVGIHTEAGDVTTAVNENNRQAKKITEAIIEMGVAEKYIQTSNFNVYSMNRYDDMSNIVGTNYAVDNTLYIIVRDLPKLSEILDASLAAGANQIYGINFDINNRAAALTQARDLAIKDAQAKAQSVADTAGVQLGEIQNISVINTSYVQPMSGYGRGGGMVADSAASVPVSAGQIVITANADLTYSFGSK